MLTCVIKQHFDYAFLQGQFHGWPNQLGRTSTSSKNPSNRSDFIMKIVRKKPVADLPLISIAMATFNGADYLQQQIESICKQTYKNIEIVVSDDNSTDSTQSILQNYSELGIIRFKRKTLNTGYKENFISALLMCKGDFIAFSDQDDVWHSNKLQILYENIADNLLVHSDCRIIDTDGNLIQNSLRRSVHIRHHDRVFLDKEFHRNSLLSRRSLCQGCTTLLHRDLIQYALPIPSQEHAHDIWFGFVAAALNRVAYVDQALTDWRVHGQNTSQTDQSTILQKLLRGGMVHHVQRRLRYVRLMNQIKDRGIRAARYPISLRDELFY